MKGSIEIGRANIYLGDGLEVTFDPIYHTVDFDERGDRVILWLGTDTDRVDHLIEILRQAREAMDE